MTRALKSVHRSVDGWEAVSHLPHADLAAYIESLTGTAPPRGVAKALAVLRNLETSPEFLQELMGRLSLPARWVADVLSMCGGSVHADLLEELSLSAPEDSNPVVGADITRELLDVGLIVETIHTHGGFAFAVPNALAIGLRPLFDAWWNADHPPSPTTQANIDARHDFQAWVLLGQITSRRPQVTQKGRLFAREEKKLAKVFPKGGISSQLNILTALRLIAVRSDKRAFVELGRVQRLLTADRATRLATRWHDILDQPSRGLATVLAACKRRPAGMPASMLRGVWLLTELGESSNWWYDARYAMHRIAGRLEHAAENGLLEVDNNGLWHLSSDALALLTPPDAEAADRDGDIVRHPNAGRCHLQPNFELIVPPETDAITVFELSRIAELVRCDQVATLSITQESVRSAVRSGVTPDAMIETLRGATGAAPPDNVLQGIHDFVADVKQARVLTGFVVIVDPEDEKRMAGAKMQPTGIPGVFVGRAEREPTLMRHLEKAGFACIRADTSLTSDLQNRLASDTLDDFGEYDEYDDAAGMGGLEPGEREGHNEPEVDTGVQSWSGHLAASLREAMTDVVALDPATVPNAPPAPKPPESEKTQGRMSGSKPQSTDSASIDGPISDFDAVPRLLGAALYHSEVTWQEMLADEMSAAKVDALVNASGRSLNGTREEAFRSLLPALNALEGRALRGFPEEDVLPIVGPHLISDALEFGFDLLIAAPGMQSVHRVTPHRMLRRGKQNKLLAHDRVVDAGVTLDISTTHFAMGPYTHDE